MSKLLAAEALSQLGDELLYVTYSSKDGYTPVDELAAILALLTDIMSEECCFGCLD